MYEFQVKKKEKKREGNTINKRQFINKINIEMQSKNYKCMIKTKTMKYNRHKVVWALTSDLNL